MLPMPTLLADFETAHCGFIHDVQLDTFGQCLATASADGHIRLWDVRKPEDPRFLADLGGHAGAVHQVAWAPPSSGILLASASADGSAAIWGRRARRPSEWHILRREALERHGAVRALSWAPAEHGIVLACASADGTVTIVRHVGPFESVNHTVEHKWECQSFAAHQHQATATSWATPAELSHRVLGLEGARLATAGDDGVKVWCWHGARGSWEPEAIEQDLPLAGPHAARGSALPQGPGDRPLAARDVSWKPWDGVCETLASVCGQSVFIWTWGCNKWQATQEVPFSEEVWKASWADVGCILLVSWGGKEQRTALLKRRLDGVWDAMDMAVQDG